MNASLVYTAAENATLPLIINIRSGNDSSKTRKILQIPHKMKSSKQEPQSSSQISTYTGALTSALASITRSPVTDTGSNMLGTQSNAF